MTAVAAIVQQQRPMVAPGPAPTPPGALPLSPGDRGPDVSSYQPNVDWNAVAASGCRFAFVKATESVDYVNPYFLRDWSAIPAAGLAVRGSYHFGQPDENAAEAELAWFLGHMPDRRSQDLLVLDLEVGSGDLKAWAITWANLCVEQSGLVPMLYSGVPFMRAHNLDNVETAIAFGDQLWIAAYQATKPALPNGWDELLFWQYTESASIPGVPGAADESIYLP